MTFSKRELLLIWLDSFIGLEYKHKKYLFEVTADSSGIKDTLTSNKDYVVSAIGQERFNLLLASATEEYLKGLLKGYERKGVRVLTLVSKEYPESLVNLELPPLVLYCKGDISLLSDRTFAIVGSRKCLPLSKALAVSYAKALSSADFTLVSGSAEGIDGAVLEYATSNNKKIISVVAGGFDNIYPALNRTLIERVENCGLVISENPPEVKSLPYFFPLRNRIIAGLSVGTLVVSAGIKSGTRYTAEYALEYGRDLFAIPYSVGIESGAGCNELIKKGAILTDAPEDILSFYGVTKKEKIFLTPEEKEICLALKEGAMHAEKLCERLNRQIFEISPTLSILEIKGVVAKTGNNVFGLISQDLED